MFEFMYSNFLFCLTRAQIFVTDCVINVHFQNRRVSVWKYFLFFYHFTTTNMDFFFYFNGFCIHILNSFYHSPVCKNRPIMSDFCSVSLYLFLTTSSRYSEDMQVFFKWMFRRTGISIRAESKQPPKKMFYFFHKTI